MRLLPALFLIIPVSQQAQTAREWVDQSIQALGGETALVAIGKTSSKSIGHILHVEQSERPEGPYVTSYVERTEDADFDKQQLAGTLKINGLIYGGRPLEGKFAVDRQKPGTVEGGRNLLLPGATEEAAERLNLGPERVMLLARQAGDLKLGKAVNYQGVPHQELVFRLGAVPVSVLLNVDTALPASVETTRQHQGFWATWGDVKSTTIWSTWDIRPGGLMFPLQWDYEKNGLPTGELTMLDVSFAPSTAALNFDAILPATPRSFAVASYKQAEIAPGVKQWTGPFNTAVIEQPDGLVVLESVNSSKFASEFLQALEKEYPGKKVKAVVSTTDAWPHFGGMRSFVANGAKVVALDRNKPILTRFLAAPHTVEPDELQTRPAKAQFAWVSKPVSIGSGPNRMVVYPISGEGSERMSMVYFPELKLLYGSDLLQPQGDTFFNPGYPAELRAAVERNGLVVDRVFAMHMPISPWTRVTGFLDSLKK